MWRKAISWPQITIPLMALAWRCTGECQHDTAAVLAPRGWGQDLFTGWRPGLTAGVAGHFPRASRSLQRGPRAFVLGSLVRYSA